MTTFEDAQAATGLWLDRYGPLLMYVQRMGEMLTDQLDLPGEMPVEPVWRARHTDTETAAFRIDRLHRGLQSLTSMPEPLPHAMRSEFAELGQTLFYGPQIMTHAVGVAQAYLETNTERYEDLSAVHADLRAAGVAPPGGLGPVTDKARAYLIGHVRGTLLEAADSLALIASEHGAALLPGYGALTRMLPPRLSTAADRNGPLPN